jgi:hypothetical protein
LAAYKSRKPTPSFSIGKRFEVVPPYVGVVVAGAVIAAGIPALREIEWSLGAAIAGAIGAGLVEALLFILWLGAEAESRSIVAMYAAKRLLAVAIAVAIFAPALHFVMEFPWLLAFVAAPGLGIVAIGLAVMILEEL